VTGRLTRAGVVGGGIMGTGIAEVCARSGLDVVLVKADVADAARARIARSLDKAVERGKTEPAAADDALGHITTTDDMAALEDRHIVIEAVVENKHAKSDVLRRIAAIVEQPEAILASNTSSIPIVDLASATNGPWAHVLGLHFFNPVPVLRLVEIIPRLLTAPETVERATAFATVQLGKDPITAPDRAGFTVNALLIPVRVSRPEG
jgi:3-hydroxybutyryl-CoA dehydrogenase